MLNQLYVFVTIYVDKNCCCYGNKTL